MTVLQAADITYCPKCQSYQNYMVTESPFGKCGEPVHGKCDIIIRSLTCANCNTFLYSYYHHILESLFRAIGVS